MKSQSIPKWAPPNLVQYLEDRESEAEQGLPQDSDFECTEIKVCYRLVRRPAMGEVWRALVRKPRWRAEHSIEMAREIALEMCEFPTRGKQTNSERKDSLLLIARRASELRALLADTNDVTPQDFAEVASRIDHRQLFGWLSHGGLLPARLARDVALKVPGAIKRADLPARS